MYKFLNKKKRGRKKKLDKDEQVSSVLKQTRKIKDDTFTQRKNQIPKVDNSERV